MPSSSIALISDASVKRGGGSVKCMVGDLGELTDDEKRLPPEVARFRKERDYRTLHGAP